LAAERIERLDDRGRADRRGPLEGPARPVEPEAHRRVAVAGGRDPALDGEVGLVDALGEDAAEHETGVAPPAGVRPWGVRVLGPVATAAVVVVPAPALAPQAPRGDHVGLDRA